MRQGKRMLLAIAVLGSASSIVLWTALEDHNRQAREFDKLLVCDAATDAATCNHLLKVISTAPARRAAHDLAGG